MALAASMPGDTFAAARAEAAARKLAAKGYAASPHAEPAKPTSSEASTPRQRQKETPCVSAQGTSEVLLSDHGVLLSQVARERQRLRRQMDRARLEEKKLRSTAVDVGDGCTVCLDSGADQLATRVAAADDDPCLQLRCELCDIPMSGPKALADHLQGRWHKQAETLKERGELRYAPRPRRMLNAKTKPSRIRAQKATTDCHFFASGHCRNGAACPYRHELAESANANQGSAAGSPVDSIHPEAMLRKVAGHVVHAVLDDDEEASYS